MLPVMAAAQPSDFKRAGIIVVMSIDPTPTSANFAGLADQNARCDCASCEQISPTALLAIQGSRTLGRFSLVPSEAAAGADLGAASASLERLATALAGQDRHWHYIPVVRGSHYQIGNCRQLLSYQCGKDYFSGVVSSSRNNRIIRIALSAGCIHRHPGHIPNALATWACFNGLRRVADCCHRHTVVYGTPSRLANSLPSTFSSSIHSARNNGPVERAADWVLRFFAMPAIMPPTTIAGFHQLGKKTLDGQLPTR
jgi:hypothetical protein